MTVKQLDEDAKHVDERYWRLLGIFSATVHNL